MNAKRLLFSIAAVCVFCSAMALDHGSISVKNTQMYAQGDNGGKITEPIAGLTLDFKLVTVGTTTWAWTELKGANIMGESWSSQLRWWQTGSIEMPTGKVENQLTGRVAGTQQTFGKLASLPTINPVVISIFQHTPGEWVFRESACFSYNYTAKNSANVEDVTAPVLAEPVIAAQTATSLTLSLAAADASNDLFFYIEDAENNYAEVFFSNQPTLSILEETDYTFSIKAIDFSGNESAVKTVAITGQTFVCNNLLEKADLYMGGVYFAPNWGQNNNYTTDVNGTNVTITLQDATYADWQAQFPVMLTTPVEMIAGDPYSLLMDVSVSKSTPFYVKFMDADDNVFLEVPRQTVKPGGVVLSAFDKPCPAGLAKISKILFDFGWNPADVSIEITNLSLCGKSSVGMGNIRSNSVLIYPSPVQDVLNISGLEKETVVSVFDITGKSMINRLTKGELNVSNLSSGIYVLNVENTMFKFVKK